jgi:hypothetical protein
MLARHPRIVGINEPNVGVMLGPFLCDLPGASTDGLDADDCTLLRAQRGNHHAFFNDEYRHVWAPALGDLLRSRFRAQAADHRAGGDVARRAVVIKEPNRSHSAEVLLAALPRSRALFLLRDGRDVVEAALAAHPGPARTVRYEDVLRDPARELRNTLDWMDDEPDAEAIATAVEEERFDNRTTGAGEFFRAASPGFWRENLREDEQSLVVGLLGPTLERLGYPS